ncbi:hypothetical protein PIB30_101047 [Stylosanthes scabra]|uniref:Uncharacterized protein n=1 Tax=Stylosanthes scabra TaxID=79078 RepID=A0ABU6ZWT7_9FABA|nr:hypothetical protein [Stylosanthes scabra]
MPAATSRRKKHNKFKKNNSSLTKTNHHSSPTVQPFQGSCDLKPLKEEDQGPLELEPYVVVEQKKNNNNIKEDSFSVGAAFDSYHNSTMEEHLNGDLKEEETHQNVEESLAKEDKEEVVVVAAADDVSDTKDEQEIVPKEENSEHVSDSVLDESFEHAVSSSPNDELNDNNALASETVESEFEPKEEQEKVLEDNNDPSLVLENEDSREPEEVVEKDVKVLEEEENVMPSNVTEDVVSSEETTLNTDVPKPDENENKVPSPIPIPTTTTEEEEVAKGSERSLVPPKESSKEESFQPLPNVPNAETTTVIVQKEVQVPNSTQNQGIVSVVPRQHTSWSSCCGIFEVLRRGGDR